MISKEEANNLIIQSAGGEITGEMQARLNNPVISQDKTDPLNLNFLYLLEEKIDKKIIDLYKPSSLLNHEVYDRLEPLQQSKAEMDAFTMLSIIREIHKLWQAGHDMTYQLENLLQKVRTMKERLEAAGGDMYII